MAPGLKLKSGNAGDREGLVSISIGRVGEPISRGSTVDRVRRPLAREKEDGAEEGEARAGKTKGGFGNGEFILGESWGLGAVHWRGELLSMDMGRGRRRAEGAASIEAAWAPRASTGMSGPVAAAMLRN